MIVSVATRFMLACFGQSEYHSMTETRQKLWTSKVGRSLASAPKLATLPPTNEAFGENVASPSVSSYLEACYGARPTITRVNFLWLVTRLFNSNSLMSTTVPEGTLLAPVQLLKLIRCSCESDMPCTKTKTKN